MQLGKRLWSLILFVLVSSVGGLLIAGLAIPAVELLTYAGRATAEGLDWLPTELETPPQSERSKITMENGKTLAYMYEENRIYMPLEKIAPIMQLAQIAVEDSRFLEHGAFDLRGTMRALISTSNGVTQGGSSLTQQLVRLVSVDNANRKGDTEAMALATEPTMARKVRELRYAIALEKKFTKEEILERYLNMAFFGDRSYGVEAAAQHYFGVAAAKLNLSQAAMLAGLVQNPVRLSPAKAPELAIERRNNVIDRMLQLGLVTALEAAEAKAETWDPSKMKSFKNGCLAAQFPFLCDYTEREFLNFGEIGSSRTERENLLARGGLTISTHFDVEVQKFAEKTISKWIAPTDPVVSVIAAIEPGTGHIIAMAQSRPTMGFDQKKGETFHNYAADRRMGGAEGFQAGSTFKMFVAAAALNQGYGIHTSYKVDGKMDFQGQTFRGCDGSFIQKASWPVSGSSSYGKLMDMNEGVRRSVNGYFVQLEQVVGVCESVKMAIALGLEPGLGGSLLDDDYTNNGSNPSFTLGAVDITPLSMVRAYATIAARGMRCDPIIISEITDVYGTVYPTPSANCEQVIPKTLADSVAHLFKQSYSGTSAPAKVSGIEMAGKTGTVSKNKAIWQVSTNPSLTVAAVISYDSNPQFRDFYKGRKNNYLGGVKVHGRRLEPNSGRETGGLLVKPVFTKAMETRTKAKFHAPDQGILRGDYQGVPSCTGQSVAGCKKVLESAGLRWYEEKVDSDIPKGGVVGLSPSDKAPKGSGISILVSNGPPPPPPTPTPPPFPTPTPFPSNPSP